MKKTVTTPCLLICLLFFCTSFVSAQTMNRFWKDGQIYFKINDNIHLFLDYDKNEVNPKTLNFISHEMITKYGINRITSPFKDCDSEALRRTLKIDFINIKDTRSLLADLNNTYEIEYAEPGALYYTFSSPTNDTYYNKKAKGHNFNLLWHLDLINAEQAWTLSEGSEDIKVAVLDNAIWAEHPDLKNKIYLQKDLANDKDKSAPPVEEYTWSHGTHCAGLIGAENNNELGIASIGNKIKLIAVKLAYDESEGDAMSNGFEAVVWAADNGANIISMSWGGPLFFQTMQNAINYAYNKGCTMLAATGNNGDGGETEVFPDIPINSINYPAGLTHVIGVGSCDIDDKKSAFSNYGTWIDVLSPGGYAYKGSSGFGAYSILSTTYNDCGYVLETVSGTTGGAESFGVKGKYDIMPGTSMATPVCAGLSGLILSANKNLTPDKLKDVLKSSCKDVSALNPQIADSIGAGRIDAFEAVKKAINEISTIVANFEASDIKISVGGKINFTDKSIGNPSSWSWEFEGGTPTQSSEKNPQNIVYNKDGLYKVKLTVSDGNNSNTEIKTALILVGKNPNAPKSAWTEQNISFEKALLGVYSIDIVNENVAWATCIDMYSETTTDEFAITTNGGDKWISKKYILSDDYKYKSLSAVSADKAWICAIKDGESPMGAIFTTSDAGASWSRQAQNIFSNPKSSATHIKMFNDKEGVCIGEPINGALEIYNTQDGGNTWTKNTNTVNTSSKEIISSGILYSLGNSIWFSSNKGKIYKSSDKGINWTSIDAPGEEISSLSFADNDNAVAISYKSETGFFGMPSVKDWKMSKTTNGGQNWTTISQDKNYLSEVTTVPDAPGMLIATNLAIQLNNCRSAYSLNWGESWTELDDSIIYTCISMYSKDIGYAGGVNESASEGGIYKWKPLEPTNIKKITRTDDINIYPNPANNFIIIENCKDSRYQILDISGKLLHKGIIDTNNKTVDISDLSEGYFLIKITNKEFIKSFKFSKLK